jgi:quercetin dioxygenase-like cupin family protein
MRIVFLVATVCVACTGSASQSAADTGAADSAASSLRLVARHADVANVAVSSIEGKPMHGRLVLKPLLRGERMTMLELHYQPGTKAPLHTHTHESLIYVVSGRVKTSIGDKVYVLGPGDAARHPPGVLHTVEALIESTVIEVKSPAPEVTTFMETQSIGKTRTPPNNGGSGP